LCAGTRSPRTGGRSDAELGRPGQQLPGSLVRLQRPCPRAASGRTGHSRSSDISPLRPVVLVLRIGLVLRRRLRVHAQKSLAGSRAACPKVATRWWAVTTAGGQKAGCSAVDGARIAWVAGLSRMKSAGSPRRALPRRTLSRPEPSPRLATPLVQLGLQHVLVGERRDAGDATASERMVLHTTAPPRPA
jgi:hypothetical protein